jgi:murein L,D-transpeptidase YafK
MKLFLTLFILFMHPQISFKQEQLKHPRVSTAYAEKEITVKNYFNNKNLKYPGFHMFLRAFKQEGKIEVWVKEQGKSNFELLTSYNFCSSSGSLGPKRKEGDRQIPEGVYYINHFNPVSNFHLSLGINYPNRSDKLLGDKVHPGSAIYIHGNCVTIGCIPITDDKIKELYLMAIEAKNNGQVEVPVHIFPDRLTTKNFSELITQIDPQVISFWGNLKTIYNSFEETHQVKKISINAKGEYVLTNTLY